MSESIIRRLNEYRKQLDEIHSEDIYIIWRVKVYEFIRSAIDFEQAQSFDSASLSDEWSVAANGSTGHIDGLIARLENVVEDSNKSNTQEENQLTADSVKKPHFTDKGKVFIVHGHDNEAKEALARFIQKLGLIPVILHEQPSSGRTIIEKFEVYSDASYAVILLTPDDVGSIVGETKALKSRARQNVVLELGYFMGKLGRRNVCALNKGDTEIPSDYHGIIYIDLDSKGAWKTELAQEFVQAGLNIKLEGLLS